MSLRGWLRQYTEYLEGLGGEPAVVVCGASALLVLSHYQGSTVAFHSLVGPRFDGFPARGVLGHLWWFGSSVVLYLAVPLMLSRLTRGSFHQRYGLGLGDWRAGLSISALFLLVMVPAVFIASRWSAFRGIYPLAGDGAYTLNHDGHSTVSWGLFATYELGYLAYFVAWEFLFRGWLINGLLPHWGRGPAILTQVLPFAVMHLGKAEPEALGSIIAAVALGILAVRTRSFWYGAALHGIVAMWMDCLSAWPALLGA